MADTKANGKRPDKGRSERGVYKSSFSASQAVSKFSSTISIRSAELIRTNNLYRFAP